MTTKSESARIDAIEAAILSLSQSVSTIANMLATQNAAPRTSRATKATKNDQQPPAPKFPKANAGTITGTVVRHAGGPRAGYGMLVATQNGEVWVNCVKAGGRPALFLGIPVGATVSYDVTDAGYVAGSEPAPAPIQQSNPANTPKHRKTASQTASTTTTVAALMTAPAPTLAPQKPIKLGETGKGCRMCAGNHGNEGTQKRELECLERIYFQQTGKQAGGIFDDAFTVWTRDFAAQQAQTADATSAVVPVASSVPTPVASVETMAIADAPVASNVAPTIVDGEHTVTLVGFPKTKTGMIKVHNTTLFSGKDGNGGRWLTNLSPALYTRCTHFTANDRLKVTVKGGVPISIKRVSKIEADTGMVEGVKGSGKQEPPVQVTRTKKDDTKTEAQRAARRAKLVSQTR